jgi:ABC-type Fe3+/spermidine/putrescine transport system ATPase subunit
MTNLIDLEHISYFYDSRKCDGLDKINFKLDAGELCAILGPSGSGKTTMLKLIAKEILPQKGTLQINSQSGTALYLPFENTQHLETSDVTLIEYLCAGNEQLNEDLVRDQISFLELSDEFYSPVKSLSLGQWHRAQLAKFFYTDASILLLDEPFIHLDPSRRQFIADSLLRLAKENQKIVCWSTHFLEDALMLADKVLILQHGVQQQFSSPSEVYWKPQNLFVAQYFGDNNLIMAVPNHGKPHSVTTALGEIELPQHCDIQENKEVILMCRPHQSNISLTENTDTLSWKMFLKKVSFFGAYFRLELYNQNRTWWVDVPTSAQTLKTTLAYVEGEEYWVSVPPTSWVILSSY